MSLSELLVIVIVAFVFLKPEDIGPIVKQIKDLYIFLLKIRDEILYSLNLDQLANIKKDNDIDKIDFYLEKIANLGKKYEGEYSLSKIRDYYQKYRHQVRKKK